MFQGRKSNDDRVAQARDLLIAVSEEHRSTCTEEDCCHHINLAGWIAHTLGVKSTDVESLAGALVHYNKTCPNCTSQN